MAAAALLSACSNGGPQTLPLIPSSGWGVAPTVSFSLDKKKGRAYLYVTDLPGNAIEVLDNHNWKPVGSITNGINGPGADWYDKYGLYVANYDGKDVTQYNADGKLTHTYSSGMDNPAAVTTDSQGNVYEADFSGGFVNEYHQGRNSVVTSCIPRAGGLPEGVAVDASDNVFVAYELNRKGLITEYKGGLNGCTGTLLGATVSIPGSMVVDKNDNLIICDQAGDAVDIIKPPYKRISGTLGSGYIEPFHVTLNEQNTHAYLVDYGARAVYVLTYPGGSKIARLGTSNGPALPWGAVDSDNFAP